MTEQKKKAASAFLVLFVFGIIALPASLLDTFLKWSWLDYVVEAGMLVGAILLYRAVRSKKLLISLVAGIVGLALAVLLGQLVSGLSAVDYSPLLWVLIIVNAVCSIICQLCLYTGAADYLRREQYPETAKLGVSAAKLAVAVIILTILIALGGLVSLKLMDSTQMFGVIGGILTMLLTLATAVVSVVQIVTRLRFFYQSRKCLLSGLPETVPPLPPESGAGEESTL